MKFGLLLFLCTAAILAAQPLPQEVLLSMEMKGAERGHLVAAPRDSVVVRLTFVNRSGKPIRLRIHDFDPEYKKLPYPVECAVRITDNAGKLHPHAKENGEWWSQYICWSALFRKDDEQNYRVIGPEGSLIYEISLADLLLVPAGGEPEGWPYDHRTGFKPGSYHLQFRFGAVLSPVFQLLIKS